MSEALKKDFQKTPMRPNEASRLKSLLFKHSGILIPPAKSFLFENRLNKMLSKYGFQTFDEYISFVESRPKALEEFVNIMTTNLTSFFRENDHFQILKNDIIPNLKKKSAYEPIRFWSAACSSGEEAYSLGMLLMEEFGSPLARDYKILATDIDTEILFKAKEGVYPFEKTSMLNPYLLNKYFETNLNSKCHSVRNELKQIIKFRKFNLVSEQFDANIKFDVIFLRNVLIYFDTDTINQIVQKFRHYLKDDGYLFLGHSEKIQQDRLFDSLGNSIYRKKR